jgi:hypothetical protein
MLEEKENIGVEDNLFVIVKTLVLLNNREREKLIDLLTLLVPVKVRELEKRELTVITLDCDIVTEPLIFSLPEIPPVELNF